MTSDLLYIGPVCYVARTRAGFEVRVHAKTHSLCVGVRATADAAIRTAQRLERYPEKARAFAEGAR
jgi:hypothetical protein